MTGESLGEVTAEDHLGSIVNGSVRRMTNTDAHAIHKEGLQVDSKVLSITTVDVNA